MAIGLALLLGIRFPKNFDAPLRSRNIADFWRRWHITLGAWVRDYLYLPLGGSRRGTTRTTLNLLFVMALVGLWHGAAATFLLWGLYNGGLMAGHRLLRDRGVLPASEWLARGTTLALVIAGLALFRSGESGVAADVVGGMLGLNGIAGGPEVTVSFVVVVLGLLAVLQFAPETWDLAMRPRLSSRAAVALGAVTGFAMLHLADPSPFLYFQF
jgi:alginate O-acetyltransferase complex protein AlgI